MTYNHFNSYSVKARMYWTQKVLSELNYDVDINGQRDKKTIKALKKLQESKGLAGTAMVDEKTFNELYSRGGSKISIR